MCGIAFDPYAAFALPMHRSAPTVLFENKFGSSELSGEEIAHGLTQMLQIFTD